MNDSGADEGPPSADPNGRRVLYVDGDRSVAERTAAHLDRMTTGVGVEPLAEPDRVVDEVDPDVIDCVVSPYRMPAADGIDVLERVRETYPEVPVVLFAGAGSERVAADAVAADVSAYVPRSGEDEGFAELAGVVETLTADAVDPSDGGAETGSDPYRQLVEAAPVPIGVYTPDGLVYCNQAAADFAGVADPARLYGRSPLDFVHPDDRAQSARRARRVLDDRETAPPVEERFVTDDGEERVGTVAAVPVTYNGEPAAQFVINDITEYERARSELERKNERLEEFAQVISHDLRNPLNVAVGYADMLRGAIPEQASDSEATIVDPEAIGDHLDGLDQSLDRMETLTDDLLQLARRGQDVEAVERVDLGEVARESWAHVETADATLSVAVDSTVAADPTRLRELFENLFRNAVEHGGPDVGVRVTRRGDGFAVVDDGCGLPDDIDDPFDPGVSTADDGTGFGLPIVRDIAEAHGWTVRATEAPDGGACFEIRDVDWV